MIGQIVDFIFILFLYTAHIVNYRKLRWTRHNITYAHSMVQKHINNTPINIYKIANNNKKK